MSEDLQDAHHLQEAEFTNEQDAREYAIVHARRHGAVLKTKRSRVRQNQIQMCCNRGSYHNVKNKQKQNNNSRKTNCPYEVYIRILKKRNAWVVSGSRKPHNHPVYPPPDDAEDWHEIPATELPALLDQLVLEIKALPDSGFQSIIQNIRLWLGMHTSTESSSQEEPHFPLESLPPASSRKRIRLSPSHAASSSHEEALFSFESNSPLTPAVNSRKRIRISPNPTGTTASKPEWIIERPQYEPNVGQMEPMRSQKNTSLVSGNALGSAHDFVDDAPQAACSIVDPLEGPKAFLTTPRAIITPRGETPAVPYSDEVAICGFGPSDKPSVPKKRLRKEKPAVPDSDEVTICGSRPSDKPSFSVLPANIQKMPLDGNCGFHGLAHGLLQNQKLCNNVRNVLLSHLDKGHSEYISRIRAVRGDPVYDVDQLRGTLKVTPQDDVLKNKEKWLSSLLHLQLAADAYSTIIVCMTVNSKSIDLYIPKEQVENKSIDILRSQIKDLDTELICLYFDGVGHWDYVDLDQAGLREHVGTHGDIVRKSGLRKRDRGSPCL